MRVLSLVTYPRPFYDEEVTALRERGVTVDVVAVPGLDSADESRSAVDYLRFYRTVLGTARADYDLVHANYGLTVPFALAQPHRPVVASLWGSDVMGSLDWVAKRSAGHCAERIVMSEEMRRELGHDAHIIPHGIDFETFQPMEQAAAREAVGWDTDGTYVLFPYDPSRPVKDYPRAERIVADVQADSDESITLKPVYGVDHEMVPQYMNAADALLLTSKHEGFPNAIKEAMACNLPVVTTDVGGLRERLGPVENSYVCESDIDLSARLADVLASGRRSDGRVHAVDLSVAATTDRILDVYQQALDH
ncbi:glycosyltransferase [Halonotius terrestris]|uniref:Glycosyltransferase n=1 Tax=Halonotius terrestris TaxID=2487750 RepID=A0A8J8P8F9_9EURY|nr:glycosyltransferase [Halonotius terrestris]